jgi:hypothetical protein
MIETEVLRMLCSAIRDRNLTSIIQPCSLLGQKIRTFRKPWFRTYAYSGYAT